MSTEVGTAYVTLVPSAKGFAAKMQAELGGDIARMGDQGGDEYGRRFSDSGKRSIGSRAKGLFSGFKGLAAGAGIAGGVALAAGFAKSAISLQADFEQTMNLVKASTNAPASAMKDLSDLAMKMGADTAFSANEASGAMLELAKAGISTSDIMGGALSGTLTLASAGGTDLATAATIASNAMNTFSLKGKDMASIASALAGGANASSASVESLGEALSQVGPGATNAGLSLQETVGALSAFDAAGVKGSDAGTSLKTMLARLVPQTDAAREAFAELGLWSDKTGNKLVDQQGNFKSLTEVAGLLAKGMKGMSDAERTAALNDAFGSDASRAAIVLGKEGAAGIRKYIKATQDQGAAQKMADARMSGTAGALERLRGSIDTVKLAFGKALSPAVTAGARGLADVLGSLPGAVSKVAAAFSSGEGRASGFAKTFAAVADFGKSLLPSLRDLGSRFVDTLLPGIRSIGDTLNTQFLPAFRRILPIIQPVAKFLLRMFGEAVIGALKGVINVIKGVLKTISGIFNLFAHLFTGNWGALWGDLKQIMSGLLQGILGAIQVWWNVGILALFKRAALFLTKGLWTSLWAGLKTAATKGFGLITKGVQSGLQAIGNLFLAGIRAYLGFWRNLFTGAWRIVVNGWRVLRSAFGGALAAIRTVVSQAFNAVKARIGGAMSAAWSLVRAGAARILSVWRNLGTGIRDAVTRIWGSVTSIFGKVVAFVGGLKGKIGDKASGMWDGILGAFRAVVNAIADLWNNTVGRLSFKAPDWVPGFGGKGFDVPDIPHLAHGGRATSASVVEIAEGGEPETAFPDSVLAGFLERMTAAATANLGRGGGRYAMTIENWEDGTGYIEEVAGGVVDDRDDLAAQGRRAG